jgi:hypothetical protein
VGALYLAYQYPEIAGIVAIVLLALAIALLLMARRFIRALFGRGRDAAPESGQGPSSN